MTAKMPKIFVCQPVPGPAIERLRQYGEVEVFPYSHRPISIPEMADAARRSDYVFCMHETPITASIAEANPQLKGFALSYPAPGIVDVEACERAGVPLLYAQRPQAPEDGGWSLNGYGLNPRGTADLMVAMVMCLAYRVFDADRYVRANGYFQEMTMDLMGQGCTGKTASVWGLGKVARQAVPRLKALDMEVLYNKRTRLPKEEEAELGIEWVGDSDELIARADYLCMLVKYEPANLKIMGEREFNLMKPTSYFVNVGRGRLVDEDAMIKALQEGTIAGAGLDVYWHEPSAYYDPMEFDPYIPEALRKLDNVILTPHNGGATYLSRGMQTLDIANAIVDDIVAREKAQQETQQEKEKP
ncbi:MAG TPA: NAD(P)-dependent oxidoreductase [Acidimicrobiales bacterium]|nr:NAD(P)-dependent oxidoreductase [Acidimicrobiales bacterium]